MIDIANGVAEANEVANTNNANEVANTNNANEVANTNNANEVARANEVAQANGVAEANGAYKLAICEMFNPIIHGQDENSSPQIHTHFLVYTIIDLPDFYSDAYVSETNCLRRYLRAVKILHGSLHETIRNYERVTNTYTRLEIIQTDILPGQETVAYLKTFWLRIVQRRWKKIYKARQEILAQRNSIRAIQEKQRTGQWPIALRHWPRFTLF